MKDKSTGLILVLLVLILSPLAYAQTLQTSWMRSFGSAEDAYCKAITTDTKGNIYMAGWFSGSSLQLNEIILFKNDSPETNQDIFVAKFDSSGFCLWARSFGGDGADYINDILVDKSGNLYICGDFYSSEISFGKSTLRNHYTILGNGQITSDIFIAGLNDNGKPLWAYCGGGVYDDFAVDLAFDNTQQIVLAANFRSVSISLGGTAITNSSGNAPGAGVSEDFLIGKFNSTGEALWLKSYGGANQELIQSIALDKDNNLYATGTFSGKSMELDSLSVTKKSDDTDIWFARLDPQSNPIWLKTLGGANDEKAADIDVDSGGNIYVTGSFNSNWLDFYPQVIRNNQVNANNYNSFFAKYDPEGSCTWVKTIGGNGNDYTDDIVIMNADMIMVTCSAQSDKIAIDGVDYLLQPGEYSPDCLILGFHCDGVIFDTALIGGDEGDFPTSLASSGPDHLIFTGVFSSQILYQAETALHNIDQDGSDIFMLKYKLELPVNKP